MKRLAFALAAALLFAAPAFGAVKRFVAPTPDRIEAELLDLINADRVKLGRPLLRHHSVLQEIARGHSAKMAAEGRMSHDFPGWPSAEQNMQQNGLCFLAQRRKRRPWPDSVRQVYPRGPDGQFQAPGQYP